MLLDNFKYKEAATTIITAATKQKENQVNSNKHFLHSSLEQMNFFREKQQKKIMY